MSRLPAGVALVLIIGCGGGGTPSEPGPTTPILTTVSVNHGATVFSTPPGHTFVLSVGLRDQNNVAFVGATSKSFSSDNVAVVTVSGDGTLTGVAVGSARVTVTVQAGSVSRTATTAVTVLEPSAEESVVTHEVRFEPPVVHVLRGGSVTWLIGRQGNPIHHNVIFTTPGAPANIPDNFNGVFVSRLFPAAGSFAYECTLHAGMVGTVHVH